MSEQIGLVKNDGVSHINDEKDDGVAHIKAEYLLPVDELRKYHEEEQKAANPEGENGTEAKSLSNKKKKKGRNYHRPKFVKEAPQKKLCRYYWSLLPGETPGSDKCPLDKCMFSHDYKSFMENKGKDLGDECHNFSTYGFCSYGLACRFGGCHIESNGSVVDEEKQKFYQENPPVQNILKKEIQVGLRKRTYDFSKSLNAFQEVNLQIQNQNLLEKENSSKATSPQKADVKEDSDTSMHPVEEEKKLGPASDEDIIPLKASEKKKIDWKDKLYLAPLTTLGNLPYRRVCKRLGADITCSEMAVATSLLQGSSSEWALVKRHSSEDLFGVQLCGYSPEAMIKCAQLLEQEVNMDFVDINMGCPIDLIYRQGAGSALLRRASALRQMVGGMTRVLSCPLTLKMRTAVYRDTQVAHTIIEKAKLWDVKLFTVHGRSKEQRYLKLADWEYVKRCAEVADPVPLFGNGDVLTYDDYIRNKEDANVAGIMLARGALMKPWVFTEIKEKREWDISSKERFDILKEFTNYGLEHWGSDSEGIEKTRRFLLEWLSFLYRYIPVGLLEQPQKINQRPALYKGRDDLETLMASNNVKDWVKISEMLLCPVPDDFAFLPKHKANSWNFSAEA